MPRPHDPCPLRWWENLTLFLLAQSPRIERIVVTQRIPGATPQDEGDDPDDEDDEALDDHSPNAYVDYLEHLYRRSPSADFEET